jgi:glycosyltransferase involved in cell wall biosynthesis
MMQANPFVSVIIPTFNRAYCLGKTLDSVLSQSFTDFEVIVIDDGSTDDTKEVVNNYSSVNYFLLDKNEGVSFARNYGIDKARGKYICFLDSDDLWEVKKLEVQVQWMNLRTEIAACHTGEIWIRKGVRVNPMDKHKKPSGDIFLDCLPACVVSPSSVMINSKVLRYIGCFDTKLPACEDYDLWLRMSSVFTFGLINQKLLVKYGGHSDQLSRKYWGMDRFRVYSLSKLLTTEFFSVQRSDAVLRMLIGKCEILLKGFLKREKQTEVDIYQKHIKTFKSLLGRPIDSVIKKSIRNDLDDFLIN